MRILFIGKRRYTNKDALRERFGRIYRLPLQWQRAGAEVELLLLDYRGRSAAQVSEGGLTTTSVPLMHYRAWTKLQADAQRIRPEVVVASGDCFVGLIGLRLARTVGAKFVFDVYDDYRKFSAYRIFAGFHALEFLCDRAALVLFASQALAERVPVGTRWELVPNGIDPSEFRPMDRHTARRAVNLPDDGLRWVGYFGSMEYERGPTDLVTAVGMLHARNPSIRLVLCGQTDRWKPEAPWVEYRGSVPHAVIPSYINACDVVALPYRRGPIIDMASSIKIAEYLFCERPIVATRTPNLMENFDAQASELGDAICNPGDPADLARAIDWQLRCPVIASRPIGHTWEGIALRTLEAFRTL